MTLPISAYAPAWGGIDRAAEEAGFTTVGQCEIDDYCIQVLELQFPHVERWRDIRDVTRESISARGIGRIDLLSGGIPCQPHSVAGKHKGSSDERDLWPELARIIRELEPRWALVENVPGLLTSDSGRFFGRILRDLAEMGYDAGWCVYGANAVGAPHKRERLLIVAHSTGMECTTGAEIERILRAVPADKREHDYIDGPSEAQPWQDVADTEGKPERTGLCQDEQAGERRGRSGNSSSENVADTDNSVGASDRTLGRMGRGKKQKNDCSPPERATDRPTQPRLGGVLGRTPHRLDNHRWPAGPGEPQHEWEPPRVARGIKHRTQRLKALGNICMPQQVYPILAAIAEIERQVRIEEEGGGIR